MSRRGAHHCHRFFFSGEKASRHYHLVDLATYGVVEILLRAGGGIRTHDLTITNRLRYQTAPHRLGRDRLVNTSAPLLSAALG